MMRLGFLLDRTAVLFLGVAAGAAMGYAFAAADRTERQVVVIGGEARVPAPAGGAAVARRIAPGTPAPPAETPVPGTPAPPAAATAATPPAAQEGIVRVGVFGDSFGDGVYSGLYRLLPAREGYRVLKFSRQSTGFTRYRSLNVETHDAGQIAAQPIDMAVIAFGANDAQGVYDNGHGYKLMTSGWQDVIGRRIDAYVAMLRGHDVQVYWVGLPKMRDPAFDADIAGLNAFYAARMRALGVPFIDIRSMTSDAQGRYMAYMIEDGTGASKLFRANDGVHMSMNGYIRITEGLVGQIKSQAEAMRARAEPAQADAERPS